MRWLHPMHSINYKFWRSIIMSRTQPFSLLTVVGEREKKTSRLFFFSYFQIEYLTFGMVINIDWWLLFFEFFWTVGTLAMTSDWERYYTGRCWWPWRKKSLRTEWHQLRLWVVQFSRLLKPSLLSSFHHLLRLLQQLRTSMESRRQWRRRPSPSRRTSIEQTVKLTMLGAADKALPMR